MTFYPGLNENYYTEGARDIKQFMDYTYMKNITINQSYWSEAEIDTRYVANDQTLWNTMYGNVPNVNRRQFSFNKIKPVINTVSGYQRRNRKSITSIPVYGDANQTSDQLSKTLDHVNSTGNILHTFSDAFEGACVAGMNLLSVWLDYRHDPVNGDIRVDNVGFNGYLIDPFMKKMDLSDCGSLWTRKYLSKTQIKSLMPGRESEINSLRPCGNRDGKFQFMPEAYNYAMQDLLIYDEFWYQETRRQKVLIDNQTGESMEWKGTDENLAEFLKSFPQVILAESEIPTVKLAIQIQDRIFYNGPNPLNIDKYPFVPVWAYYRPELADFPYRIQGITRSLRDAQFLYNRRKVIELDILESQINSGYIYKPDSLIDPNDVFLTGQGRGLAVKPGASLDDIRPIRAPGLDPSIIQLSEILGKEIREISGVNEELLGSADDDKAGILSILRQGAGLTSLQSLFDNADLSLKLLGEIEQDIIMNNWTPGKVAKIINEEPTQEFYNRAFQKYQIRIEEGLNTATQKQMQSRQMVAMIEAGLLPADPQIMEMALEGMTIQNKKDIIDVLRKQQETAQQQQQQQSEIQQEVLKAQINDLQSRAMANEGLGYERASRIQENQALAVERIAEAQKDRDLGTYDRIKAIKEITQMDLTEIERSLAIVQGLQASQRMETEADAKMQLAQTTQQPGAIQEKEMTINQ